MTEPKIDEQNLKALLVELNEREKPSAAKGCIYATLLLVALIDVIFINSAVMYLVIRSFGV